MQAYRVDHIHLISPNVEPLQVRPGLRIAYIEAPDKVRIELTERK